MRTALLGIVTAAAAALFGWLAGPADAVLFSFFGLWGVLLLWSDERVSVRAPGTAPADREPEPDLPVRT